MARKLTDEEWASIRTRWEEEPKMSLAVAASGTTVSKEAVRLRARRDRWHKRGDLASINSAATRRADSVTNPNQEVVDPLHRQVVEPLLSKRLASRDEAVDKRADVLVKHRDEVLRLDRMQQVSQSLFAVAVRTQQRDDWWRAKISADTCREHVAASKMKQDMERRAWGLDVTVDPDAIRKMSDAELERIVQGKL